VRGSVVLADVGLDLDDPPDPPPVAVVTDEPPAEQGCGDLERRQREQLVAIEPPGQRPGCNRLRPAGR